MSVLPVFQTPRLPVRAKVRCGMKVNGKARAVDYFLCDGDAGFAALGPRPRELAIRLPYDDARGCFSVSQEWWRGRVSACYSDDGITAMRKAGDDGWTFNPTADRRAQPCRGTECDAHADGHCRPTGRLYFHLDGQARDGVYQLDTHGVDSIKGLQAAIAQLAATGPLTGRRAILTVRMDARGQKRFPVLELRDGGSGRARLDALLLELNQEPGRHDDWIRKVGIASAIEACERRLRQRAAAQEGTA